MSKQPVSLRLVGLSKRYRTGDQALSDVSLRVPPGQVLGLIGPSGAGKSTLIRCINRLVEPSGGQVFLSHPMTPGKAHSAGTATGSDSIDEEIELTVLGRRGLRRARRRIGMIFQEYALVERLTVMENVLSGRLGYVPFWRSWLRRFPPEDIANAYRLLDRVGLADQADKRADALSGGQRQRVGVARALAQEPELLLVDEPTASLDPKTSRQIMRLLREVCAERELAAIVNIHDVVLAQQFMMRIIGLRAGRIVYDGPPDGLTPAVLTAIYGEEDWAAASNETGTHDGDASAAIGDQADRSGNGSSSSAGRSAADSSHPRSGKADQQWRPSEASGPAARDEDDGPVDKGADQGPKPPTDHTIVQAL